MLEIEIHKNNITKEIEEFLLKHKNNSFFQSEVWARINKEYFNKDYYFVAVKENNTIKLATLILENKIFFNYKYLYCPAGPIFDFEDQEVFDFFIKQLKKNIKDIIFIRIDPKIDYKNIGINKLESHKIVSDFFLKKEKFIISKDQKQPETTLIIELENKTDENILKQMKEKGRYNIKIAEKNNIIVKKTGDIDSFYNLMLETTKRDGFFANNKDYYKKLVENSNEVSIYSAYYNDKVIASAITTFHGDKAMYYYGASTSQEEYRKIMAPYMLQWEMIKDARKMNYKYYDFLGISPIIDNIDGKYYIFNGLNKYEFNEKEDADNFIKNHKFYGITQFKTRFGGEVIDYIGAIDKVYNIPIYYILNLLKYFRKVLRAITKKRI